ncbi:MAG TPA: carboxypeptidase-like regulatory domain-containing protein [Terriglobales bacterium]|nr:carboxypeptidase-like regulatory domain-containing protein [Terriglobales bacterium]
MVSIAAGQRSPATASQPAAKLPRIAGTVVNAVTGNPLARARVSLQDARNPQNLRWTITSEDGRFEFAQLAPGKYAMRGAKRGFLAAGYEQHEQFSTAIVSGVGLDTEHLVLRLAPVAVLSGRVLNEAGEPVRHATVSLYVEDRSAGVDRIQRVRDESTDDQGSYEFWPLGAGTYFLAATASPWYALQLSSFGQPDRAEPSPTFDPSLDAAYPVTYYKDASEPDEASPIPLRGGDNLEADFHLNPVPALHLRFRVSDVELHGFIMPRLLKPSFDGIQDVPFHGMGTVSPGIFEIAGVPAGRYVVQMSRSQPPGQPIETDAVELDLNADGQELDSSSGTPAGSVHAAAKLKGQEQLPRQLRILLRNSRRRVVDEQEINDTGEVEFRNLAPGKYELLAWAPGEAYSVLRISLAGEEIAGDVLPVTAGSSLAISILLAGSAMRVEGFAKRKGQPVPGAMVVLVPETPASNRDLFRRDQSDLDGSFSLRNVIPGSYTVCAIADGWDLDWAKPAVIASYCKHGRPVVVPDRAEGSIELESFVEVESR